MIADWIKAQKKVNTPNDRRISRSNGGSSAPQL